MTISQAQPSDGRARRPIGTPDERDPRCRFSPERLLAARIAYGLSREAVALMVGCNAQSIYLWETNRRLPRLVNIERIARVLEIDPGDLFDPGEAPLDAPVPPAAA